MQPQTSGDICCTVHKLSVVGGGGVGNWQGGVPDFDTDLEGGIRF